MSRIARLLLHHRTSARALLFACCSFTFVINARPALAVSCQPSSAARFPDTHLPDADAALDKRDAAAAIPIYQKALLADPTSPVLNAALAEAYLNLEKETDADATLTNANKAHPHSAILETVVAEAQLQEGRPWDAQETIAHALADDPCYSDAHLFEGELFSYISMYGSAAKQFTVAWQLAPHESGAENSYLRTLRLPQRIAAAKEMRAKLDLTPAMRGRFDAYITSLEQTAANPRGACTLVSSGPSTAEIPMLPMMGAGHKVTGVGLDVKIEQYSTHLDIDTGAGGLVISSAAAARAGLQYVSDAELAGVGSGGVTKAHFAYAQSIKIGSLEFHDCPVKIFDRQKIHLDNGLTAVIDESDGIIGMDTLRQFLVTLDYPHGKLMLAPLPAIPNAPLEAPRLETGSDPQLLATGQSKETPHSFWNDRYVAPEMKDYSNAYRVWHDLVVPASIGKGKVRLFILDTGAFRTLVTTDAAQDAGKLHRDQSGQVTVGLSGRLNETYYVDQMTFNFAHVSVVTNKTNAVSAADLSLDHHAMQISGFIGASALRQCIVHLDYRDGLVKLDYTPGPSRF